MDVLMVRYGILLVMGAFIHTRNRIWLTGSFCLVTGFLVLQSIEVNRQHDQAYLLVFQNRSQIGLEWIHGNQSMAYFPDSQFQFRLHYTRNQLHQSQQVQFTEWEILPSRHFFLQIGGQRFLRLKGPPPDLSSISEPIDFLVLESALNEDQLAALLPCVRYGVICVGEGLSTPSDRLEVLLSTYGLPPPVKPSNGVICINLNI